MHVDTTVHFEQLQKSKARISVHQGGTRSAKTYNILLWFIVKLLTEDNKVFTIARKERTTIKATAYRDFQTIMESLGIFDPENLHKSDLTYKLGTNLIEFIGLDRDRKSRGRKRDYLFINEANEITWADWNQLIFRTSDKIVLDYNPSDEHHFIYDKIIPRDDSDFLRTTYKNNPFLEKSLVDEIERLEGLDENYWRIYGLGEKGVRKATIYTNWEIIDSYDDHPGKNEIYGLDFGYNDPNAMLKIKVDDKNIIVQEVLYRSYQTTGDLIEYIHASVHRWQNIDVIADNARPEAIDELCRSGIRTVATKKGKNSVVEGIDWLKHRKILIDQSSANLIKEIKMYKWREDKDGNALDKPLDIMDHLLDALRYAATGGEPIADDLSFLDKVKWQKPSAIDFAY